jgi:hypothetical protein
MRRRLRPGEKPLLAIVDLHDLPDADEVLRNLRLLMKPGRVIVLAAPGSIAADDVARLGYVVLRRPISIGEIVEAARRLRAALAVSHGEI